MGAMLLVASLSFCVAAGGLGVFMMAQGWFGIGLATFLLGLLAAMLLAGGLMPRPVVVPRPDEEDQY